MWIATKNFGTLKLYLRFAVVDMARDVISPGKKSLHYFLERCLVEKYGDRLDLLPVVDPVVQCLAGNLNSNLSSHLHFFC